MRLIRDFRNRHDVFRPFALLTGFLAATLVIGPAQGLSPLDEDDFSTVTEARRMQEKVIDLIDDVRRAVVGVEIEFRNDDGRITGVAGGSGTIIDVEDGIILTAGHVGRADGLNVSIYLHDGRRLRGKTLGQHLDGQEDCGLIRINPDELAALEGEVELHQLEMGDSDTVEKGDWVVVFGHTLGIEKDPWRPPPARIGRITSSHDHVLTMDAPLNSGDSGGPMVDMNGVLIGINESCAMHPFENAATSVNIAKERYESMRAGNCTGATLAHVKDNLQLFEGMSNATRPIVFQRADTASGRHAGDVKGAFADAVWDASDWTIRVFNGGEQIGLGLVIDESGLLLTKASEIDPREERILVATPTGLLEDATVLGHDSELDLLMLQLPPGEWIPAPLNDAVTTEAGAWVVSAGPDAAPISFGIQGLDSYLSDLSIMDRGFLGVQTDSPGRGRPGAYIQRIVPGCAARRAGLRRGDLILRVESEEVRGRRALVDILRGYRANDVVRIDYVRDGEEFQTSVRLGSRWAIANSERESGNMMVPVSRRDSGFGRVIQHDSLITPEECGGPLVDLDGNFIGMNIARSDRTKTYALPADVLVESVRRMKNGLGGDKAWVALDPLTLQIPLESRRGTFTLHAQDAQVFGPTARFIRISGADEIGCIGHWLSNRDEILWVIDDPDPGAFEVFIEYACDPEGEGTPFQMQVGEDQLDSRVSATGDWSDFQIELIGEIEIDESRDLIVSISATEDPPLALMNLRSLKLVPIID